MKGRDKRRRAKERQQRNIVTVTGAEGRRCKVLVAIVDETNCRAERRFQQAQQPNNCEGCEHLTC